MERVRERLFKPSLRQTHHKNERINNQYDYRSHSNNSEKKHQVLKGIFKKEGILVLQGAVKVQSEKEAEMGNEKV